MKKGERETKHCRRITMSMTAAIIPNESSWGGSRGCLGFLVYLFSALNASSLHCFNFLPYLTFHRFIAP
jgi:hypothetical protein